MALTGLHPYWMLSMKNLREQVPIIESNILNVVLNVIHMAKDIIIEVRLRKCFKQ